MSERTYFTENELKELAAYLGMSLPEFLKARADGKIGVSPRPRDATPVFFVCDINRWPANGRPAQWLTSDPSGVSRKPLQQEK